MRFLRHHISEPSNAPEKNRQRFIVVAVVILLLSGIAIFIIRRNPPPRNLVMICFDTVRFDSFELPDSIRFTEPFSPWSGKAIRFQNTQSTSPWTVPAVASVFSGLYPSQHTAGRFEAAVPNLDVMKPSALPDSAETLTEILRKHKYKTAAFVAQPWFRPTGLSQGFGEFRLVKEWKIKAISESWITNNKKSKSSSQPFFLYLHFMEAHEAHMRSIPEVTETSKTLPGRLRRAAIQLAPNMICRDPDNEMCIRYLAYTKATLHLRRTIADLLNFLKEKNLIDNTVVVLFSDHGEEFKDHLNAEHARGQDPRGYYGVGHGHSMYQELLHVPLFVWHPSFSGWNINTPVSLVDITPTLMQWLRIEDGESNWSGRNLADVPNLNTRSDLMNAPLFSSAVAYGPQQTAVIWKGWKKISFADSQNDVVYDLQRDPGETNVRNDRKMQQELDRFLIAYNSTTRRSITQQTLTAEEVEELKALGYLSNAKNK